MPKHSATKRRSEAVYAYGPDVLKVQMTRYTRYPLQTRTARTMRNLRVNEDGTMVALPWVVRKRPPVARSLREREPARAASGPRFGREVSGSRGYGPGD